MRIPEHIVDQILQTARIEEVIGEFVHLKRAGSSLKGLSPFVDEKTPSFVVSPAKQIFKCFSTGIGGNVTSFLMEKEHYTFVEALRWLANKYNVEIPEEREPTAEERAQITERESLYIINEYAKNHFSSNILENEEGKTVGLSYFEERGFTMETIKKFDLGYCLNTGDDFTKNALAKGYKFEYLEKVGLVKSKDDRKFDFFRGRVMFPIHSVSGRVLGFGGRTLFTDKKIAKYFNSPESIIYNKSEILYGLYYAKSDIVKYDNCFMCEGYTDVISMHQAGVANSVSSSGTSLTKEQIRLIKRYTNNVTILYDGDSAGIKASFRGIDLILEEGLNVKVVLFPDGDDPDSYSKKVSTTEFKAYIEDNTKDFVSFKAELLLATDGEDPLKRAVLIKDMVHSISLIPDGITQSIYSKEIAKKFEISETVLQQELAKLISEKIKKEQKQNFENQNPTSFENSPSFIEPNFAEEIEAPTIVVENKFKEEKELLRVLLKYSSSAIETIHIDESNKKLTVEVSVAELIIHEVEKDGLTLQHPLYLKLYSQIKERLTQNIIDLPSYWLKNSDNEIVSFISSFEMESEQLSPKWLEKYQVETATEHDHLHKLVFDAIYTFKASKVLSRIREIHQLIAETVSDEDNERMIGLLQDLGRFEKVKMELSKNLGRTFIN